jgi:hypothetical protein
MKHFMKPAQAAAASSRLDTRRQLIIEEANAIGTAYLRLDTLADHDQPENTSFLS